MKNKHHFSRFTEKCPSIAERFIRTVRNLSKKLVFGKGNADWLNELPSVIKKYINTIHQSIKMTPTEASLKKNEKTDYTNLQDRRIWQQSKNKIGKLIRTADIKRVFSKGDTTNYSNKFYTITEVIHYTILSYRINYLPERYNETLLLPLKPSLDENHKVMKELNIIQ